MDATPFFGMDAVSSSNSNGC